MTTIKVIKTEAQYEGALSRIEELMVSAMPETSEGDELELLVALVEHYEAERHPVSPATPTEAIKLRMEQLGLTPRDLVSYIGSKGRVSEVLSGKRPLTLGMIRALHVHLGIPADILLQASTGLPAEPEGIDWTKYPLKEMVQRGWFSGVEWARGVTSQAEDLVRLLHERAGGGVFCAPEACYRLGYRKSARTDPYALHAWVLGVRARAMTSDRQMLTGRFDPSKLDMDFLRQIAGLSVLKNGPRVAVDFLDAHGIVLIYEKHFDRTYLDGAALLLPEGTPVIGLTLRYDRIDYFWFCLLHELAHIGKHLNAETPLVLDDFDISPEGIEKEADITALEAMIPQQVWDKHPARSGAVEQVHALARELGIHPALVAGRVRHDTKNYRILSRFVGLNMVRRHFEEGA